MDPMSVDRLFHLLAGVVDVITSIAAVLLVAVLTSRLRRRPVSISHGATNWSGQKNPMLPRRRSEKYMERERPSSPMLPGPSQPSAPVYNVDLRATEERVLLRWLRRS